MYDIHEPRAVRQLPIEWRLDPPRRRASTSLWPALLLLAVILAAFLLAAGILHL